MTTSNVIQGRAAAAGLGAVIVCAQPLFHAIKWAGVAYLPPSRSKRFGPPPQADTAPPYSASAANSRRTR
jgi:hypothetical protein